MLDEHGRNGRARREGLRELAHRGAGQAAAVVGERALGRLLPLGRVEAEAEERPDRASGAAAAEVDRRDLLGVRVALDEERAEDPQRAAALEALERADEAAFERRPGREGVDQEVGGRLGHRTVGAGVVSVACAVSSDQSIAATVLRSRICGPRLREK